MKFIILHYLTNRKAIMVNINNITHIEQCFDKNSKIYFNYKHVEKDEEKTYITVIESPDKILSILQTK